MVSAGVGWDKSVALGMYWLSPLPVFWFEPRCDGHPASPGAPDLRLQASHHVVAAMCFRWDSGKRSKLRLSWVLASVQPTSLGSLMDQRSILEQTLGASAASARS